MDKELIVQKINELKEKAQLNRHERRYLAKLENKMSPSKISSNIPWKSILTKFLIALTILFFMGGLYFYIKSRPNLPPIDMSWHIEENPPNHMLDTAMPEVVQKHMLEHADGKGDPGIIIQYNCNMPYRCEPGLVSKLKQLVKKYPKNVYLAPGNYSGMIILTRLNKREILNSYNEPKILEFINVK